MFDAVRFKPSALNRDTPSSRRDRAPNDAAKPDVTPGACPRR